MTVMEGLIGTNFIRYVSNHMQRVIEVTIYQAGSSPDWTDYQLPTAVYGSAHQMMLMLSNIASLNNAGSNGQDHVSYTVEDFLAGMAFGSYTWPVLFKLCGVTQGVHLHLCTDIVLQC